MKEAAVNNAALGKRSKELEIHPAEMRRKYHGFLFKETEAPSVEGTWARRAWGLLEQIHERFFLLR